MSDVVRELRGLLEKAPGERWIAGKGREDGTAQVYSPNNGPCRVIVPIKERAERERDEAQRNYSAMLAGNVVPRGEADDLRTQRDAATRSANAALRDLDAARAKVAELEHALASEKARAESYREAEALKVDQMLRQCRVCPKCPGGIQTSPEWRDCPSCGEPYPLQSLSRLAALESQNARLVEALEQVEAVPVSTTLRQAESSLRVMRSIAGGAIAALRATGRDGGT